MPDDRTRSGQDTDPTPVTPEPRAKRSSIGAVRAALSEVVIAILKAVKRGIDKWADRIILAIVMLALAGLTYLYMRVSGTASDARDVASDAKGAAKTATAAAETATAQGITGQAGAVKATTATAAVVSTSKEKADSTAADLQRLTDRVNSLEAELARARSRMRRKPIKLSPKTSTPAPASVDAAVEQASAASAPAKTAPP